MLKLFFFAISIVFTVTQYSNDTNLTLNYYHTDHRVYSIVKEEKIFKILTKLRISCLRAPCNFPVLNIKTVDDEKDSEKLETIFYEIFKDSDIYVKIANDELTSEQLKIIFDIFENNNIYLEIKYEIMNRNEFYLKQYNERGYSCEKLNDTLICTIAMGEKRSGGFFIEIKKVKIKGNSVIIYVNEILPKPGDAVTDAITYPIAKIKFNKEPDEIEVVNNETGEKFKRII